MKTSVKLTTLLLTCMSLLHGCGDLGIHGAAYVIIQDHLRSPDSLEVKDVEISWSGEDQKGNPAYIVRVDYTALDAFNVAIRHCNYVAFRKENGFTRYEEAAALHDCSSAESIGGRDAAIKLMKAVNFGYEL